MLASDLYMGGIIIIATWLNFGLITIPGSAAAFMIGLKSRSPLTSVWLLLATLVCLYSLLGATPQLIESHSTSRGYAGLAAMFTLPVFIIVFFTAGALVSKYRTRR